MEPLVLAASEAMVVQPARQAMEETGPLEMRLHPVAATAATGERPARWALEDLEQARQAMEPMVRPQPPAVTEAMAETDFPQ